MIFSLKKENLKMCAMKAVDARILQFHWIELRNYDDIR